MHLYRKTARLRWWLTLLLPIATGTAVSQAAAEQYAPAVTQSVAVQAPAASQAAVEHPAPAVTQTHTAPKLAPADAQTVVAQTPAAAQTHAAPELAPELAPEPDPVSAATLSALRAGEVVPEELLSEADTEAFFTVARIDSTLFRRIEGRSFPAGCTTPRDELRCLRVLHCDFEGQTRLGEMICNRAIADDLRAIFRTLYRARYPIARMVLIDRYDADDTRSMEDNNSSAFNFRFVAGTRRLSNHSRGRAVDINPLYNPCVRMREGRLIVEPEAGRPYADRTRRFRGKIDTADRCYKEFVRRGFVWGGSWKSLKDYQHFEKPESPE